MSIPTPETDTLFYYGRPIPLTVESIIAFAKEAKALCAKLERERDAAQDWQSIKVTKNGETHPLGRLVEMLERERDELRTQLRPNCLINVAALPPGAVGSMYSNDAKACLESLEDTRTRLENALSDKVIAEAGNVSLANENDRLFKQVGEGSTYAAELSAKLSDAEAQIAALQDKALAEVGENATIQRLRSEIAELNANYLKVMVERDRLAAWKKDALTVIGQWNQVDAFVRSHPSLKVGDSVSVETLRMLREGDELRASIGVVESWMPKPPENLREDIIRAINCRSAENGSNTPDWILGDFLMASLEAFDAATNARTTYYKIPDDAPMTDPPATTVG